MDIAKYIGLYLFKNNYCYLHGLGNLEIKRKPAAFEGESLHAPEYEVKLTPGGSIDDALANFIATYEQTSISKAANALRDFSIATRAELSAGKEVEIPGIGRFVDEHGAIGFIGNPHLQHVPPPVPVIRMAKRTEEAPDFHRDFEEGKSKSEIAWGRIALLAVVVLIIAGAAVFGYRYFKDRPMQNPVVQQPAQVQPSIEPPVQTLPADTTVHQDSTQIPPPAVAPTSDYLVVLNHYSNQAAADRRTGFLTRNGNKVEAKMLDSMHYVVVMRMPYSAGDTTHVLDSLRRFFNPKGRVYILH